MSYFNSAFRKSFLGTKATQAGSGTAKAVDNGFLTATGVHSRYLSSTASPYTLGVGTFGFFNKDTYVSVNNGSAEVTGGLPLVLASSSILPNDKIGPFHGGYNESNKSKLINPKYVHKFTKMTAAAPEQIVVHVGNTNLNAITAAITVAGVAFTNGTFTNVATTTAGAGTGLTVDVTIAGGIVTDVKVNNNGTGYVDTDVVTITDGTATTDADFTLTVASTCSFDFMCDQTYNLRLDLWGAPVLRLLNHDAYKTYAANTGCCTGAVPTNVDSTLVMIDWANQIINDPLTKDFVRPIVYNQYAQPLFATAAEAIAAGYTGTELWSTYVSPGYVAGKTAGIRLVSAYVETSFGNCSFQITDNYEKEIVNINASLTDLTGNPCDFSALCITTEVKGFQGQGFGETVLRDIILDESYLQNKFHEDQRLREINQGDQYLSAVTRGSTFTRYQITHSVMRHNNPTGVYDNDQYCLNIYVPAATATAFETFMATWLGAAGTGVTLETFGHTATTTVAI